MVPRDDGDGHYAAWKFSGKRLDALKKLAEFRRDCQVAEISGDTVIFHSEGSGDLDGFWIGINPDDDGEPSEFVQNFEKFPAATWVY